MVGHAVLDVDYWPRPRIVARNIAEGAQILIFLVEWIFAHEGDANPNTLTRRFNADFRRKFGTIGVGCDLTSLGELLRAARTLYVRM